MISVLEPAKKYDMRGSACKRLRTIIWREFGDLKLLEELVDKLNDAVLSSEL